MRNLGGFQWVYVNEPISSDDNMIRMYAFDLHCIMKRMNKEIVATRRPK